MDPQDFCSLGAQHWSLGRVESSMKNFPGMEHDAEHRPLDLECFPKASVLKAWLPTWCWQKVVEMFRGGWRLMEGHQAHGGDRGVLVPSSLSRPSQEVGGSTLPRTLSPTRGLSHGSARSWAATSCTVSQNKSFLFVSWLSQAFVMVMES